MSKKQRPEESQIRIDRALKAELKALAALTHRDLFEVVNEVIRRGLLARKAK